MPQFTKRAIADTFVRLLNERSLDKIAIKDIVDECQINRNTFYYYYQDIYALLEEVLEQHVRPLLTSGDADEGQEGRFLRGIQYAIDHKRALYHIYNSSRREHLETYLNRLMDEILRDMIAKKAQGQRVSEADGTLIADLCRHAILGMVLTWLQGGMKEEPTALFSRARALTDGVVEQMIRNVAAYS